MKKYYKTILLLFFLGLFILTISLAISQNNEEIQYEYKISPAYIHPLEKERLELNIDKYPEQKYSYEIFSNNCNNCHNLSLVNNSFYFEEQWDKIVSRMTLKDSSRISKRLAKTITKFLKFLSKEKIKNPETLFKKKTTNIDPSLLSTIRLSKNRIDINDGKILYENYCSTCHGENGEGGEGLRLSNPEMIDIYLRNEAHFYKNTIKMGRKGTLMKGWGYEYLGTLNENQINSIIEYIKQQWFTIPTEKTEPSEYDIKTLNISSTIESGEKIYNSLCFSCHNPMISTSNAPDLRNYSFVGTDRNGNSLTIDNEQLRYIIKNGRDNTLMKPFSMKENGIFELNDKDIDSIILYIRKRPVVYK